MPCKGGPRGTSGLPPTAGETVRWTVEQRRVQAACARRRRTADREAIRVSPLCSTIKTERSHTSPFHISSLHLTLSSRDSDFRFISQTRVRDIFSKLVSLRHRALTCQRNIRINAVSQTNECSGAGLSLHLSESSLILLHFSDTSQRCPPKIRFSQTQSPILRKESGVR